MFKYTLIPLLLLTFSGCEYSDVGNTNPSVINTDTNSVINKSKTISSSIPMIAILINYNNIKIKSDDTVWHQKLFGIEESQLNHYYRETSNHNFMFSQVIEQSNTHNDGIVSVSLNKNHPNRDIDSGLFERVVYSDLKLALDLADDSVDFSLYDTNADGYISANELIITFIMAGYEDAYEGMHVTNGIWAHQSCMTNSSQISLLDSVSLMSCENNGNFAIFGELHNKQNPYDATIGIIAHELGHSAFNLPDLYNTYNPNSGGIGHFGIMGSGTWSTKNSSENPGHTPTHFSAWSKVYNNWITPTIEKSTSTILYETASIDYNIIKIPINSSSYYLLENRNNSGYDRGLNSLKGSFDGGIAIWKIDETKLSSVYIENNNVNSDSNNKGIDLVEAVNGSIDYYGDAGHEKALYYHENINYFSTLITNISQRGSSMTLNIN